jgi:acyl-coenzyme A synthetase/AMP-(fatty) acid ligase
MQHFTLKSKKVTFHNIISLSITTILDAIVDLPQEPLQIDVPTEAAAYIIYTSGSTGKPKVVCTLQCHQPPFQWKKELELVRQIKSFH